MKHRIYILTAALSLAAATSQAVPNAQLEIIESGEAIFATFNGSTPIPLTITGPKDGWTIQLPSDYSLNSPSLDVLLGEPENALQHNEILVGTQPQFLTWTSDIGTTADPAGITAVLPTSILIPNAGTYGPSNLPFDLTLTDRLAAVPDASSTFTLFTVALLGLLGVSRLRSPRAA